MDCLRERLRNVLNPQSPLIGLGLLSGFYGLLLAELQHVLIGVRDPSTWNTDL